MWDFYAPEPRMRLNLGIRRRLAPLLENDPQRIMLLNSILLTFIGSPVIYYGDEIGMGDNIWLEDRDGVRTPMQWDDSPGAGFSDASPDEFYAPLIDDETYGYEKVNVEAQRKVAKSLLNRLRRMIQVRKNYLVFGRGGMELVDAKPKSVLAYLRTSVNETMLVFNNLSSEAQDVTVSLAEQAGTSPIDVLTGERLPEVSKGPYSFTLKGYSFRWLRL